MIDEDSAITFLREELQAKDESLQVMHRRLAEANTRIEELEQIIKELKHSKNYDYEQENIKTN